LPGEFREAIVLRELHGCSYREIAQIVDVPIGTVMSRLARTQAAAALAGRADAGQRDRDMSCRDNAKLLDGYMDGELDLPAALALEDHLQSCGQCKAALERLRALRLALRRHAELAAAPAALRQRIALQFAQRQRASLGWGWGLVLATPGMAALVLVGWLVLAGTQPPAAAPATRVVYHISSTATARDALRNLGNHLSAAPHAKVIVVAHNEGVDFLLRGARDASGETFEPAVRRFLERGVEFRVCSNTLERRGLGGRQLIPAASLVPSGIAEIGRLQAEEGYAYMRL
jgi:intracellular sulfur oxidation DsrE/DsrF family protein